MIWLESTVKDVTGGHAPECKQYGQGVALLQQGLSLTDGVLSVSNPVPWSLTCLTMYLHFIMPCNHYLLSKDPLAIVGYLWQNTKA